mgnify:CR=1 FL=1
MVVLVKTLILLTAIAVVSMWVSRIVLARRIARDSGQDPRRAGALTMLDDDGLSATYLASRMPPGQPTRPPGGGADDRRPTIERLRELDALLAEGAISTDEHERTRDRILRDL